MGRWARDARHNITISDGGDDVSGGGAQRERVIRPVPRDGHCTDQEGVMGKLESQTDRARHTDRQKLAENRQSATRTDKN